MEIGSFIELQMPQGLEYYKGDVDIARLNTGRAAIFHAFRLTECEAIWLPYYQCDTVRDFLLRKGLTKIKYYHIDKLFRPIDIVQQNSEAVLLVNYYGVMSNQRMRELANNYKNVIIDNSQAFFSKPIDNCYNVYSARKFMGVPDGAYVIGDNAYQYVNEYEQGYSSDTSLFLLQRIEYGCEGKAYESRSLNEHRVDTEDIKKMSKLTRYLLDGCDYESIKNKRQENFALAHELLKDRNLIDIESLVDRDIIPMVYPLVIENNNLLKVLLEYKHFQGHWWSYLLDELDSDTVEYWLSRYIIPITIDQRYCEKEIKYISNIIHSVC